MSYLGKNTSREATIVMLEYDTERGWYMSCNFLFSSKVRLPRPDYCLDIGGSRCFRPHVIVDPIDHGRDPDKLT